MRSTLSILIVAFALGCGGSSSSQEPASEAPPAQEPDVGGDEVADRPQLTAEECEQRGGTLVGDIGDGATHRPDYVCASGAAPIGNVSLGIEGSVCCPQ